MTPSRGNLAYLRRLPDWRMRLDAFITLRRHRVFSWHDNNCAVFAADAVAAITGTDPAEALRPHCTSRRAAMRVLEAHGGLHALATAAFGQPIATALAQDGDLLLMRMPGTTYRRALGIAFCGHVAGPGLDGLHLMERDLAVCAWRVGEGAAA